MSVTDSRARSTFLFADLAGYSALTEAHGDEAAAVLVAEFAEAAGAAAAEKGGQRVKTIGDAVFLYVPDAPDAVRIGVRLCAGVLPDHGAPVVRVGMHSGNAVQRDGDWFGAAVNLAARVAAIASGRETLVTDATRAAASSLEEIVFEARGLTHFRNVRDPVRIFAAIQHSRRGADPVLDPVCRMAVVPARSAGRLSYAGNDYYFCSLRCVTEFASRPELYVSTAAGRGTSSEHRTTTGSDLV